MWTKDFYKDKKVLITGHTGFKGTWLSMLLKEAGADVTGYSLEAPTKPSLFDVTEGADGIRSVIGDVRDLAHLSSVFDEVQPQIVFHLAAQPIVRESYKDPVYTYEVNVMGTVNVLECVRTHRCVKSVVNVTTDKVYENKEWAWGYRENDNLNGFDPYSNSKSCSELVTDSYKKSFFEDGAVRISTVRAGNVIGGGDFAVDRIIPDCFRASAKREPIIVRNPYSVRPFQHVLEPLNVYMDVAQKQWEEPSFAGSYNVGPEDRDCVCTGDLVDLFCEAWGEGSSWINRHDGGPHEAGFLKLDCSRIRGALSWRPVWGIREAIAMSVEWYKAYAAGEDMLKLTKKQIEAFAAQRR